MFREYTRIVINNSTDMGNGTKPKTERNSEIYRMRTEGMTFEEIGKKYRITKKRVFDICKAQEKKLTKNV